MRVGRNDSCPCGSGRKYKKCCLNKSNVGRQLDLKGKTAEEFVHNLAEKSFLEDWCYKNPKLPDGKELCDLLIVYDNIAIIWQIKDLKLDYDGKYKKSEIEDNILQISGARRSLFKLKTSIELENPRRGKEIFDPSLIKEIYLISALLGEPQDFFSFVENLDEHIVHVFTREFTETALKELDTIQDFVDYLREKESLLPIPEKIVLLGEEKELLAYYLMHIRSFEELKKANMLVIEEGWWDNLQKRAEYHAKKQADSISYGWDEMINRAHTCGGGYEKVARELARSTRFERRFLAKSFFDAHVLSHNTEKDTFRRVIQTGGVTYCFMFLDDPEPRERRKDVLCALCYVARGTFKQNKKVIGIATEMKILPECSYDFCVLELPEWDEDEQQEMERIQKQTGILTDAKLKMHHEDEYPQLTSSTRPFFANMSNFCAYLL